MFVKQDKIKILEEIKEGDCPCFTIKGIFK